MADDTESEKQKNKQALQAQQPKSQAQDTFTVTVGGVQTTIARGDMTDEEWDAAKKSAMAQDMEVAKEADPSKPPMAVVEDSEAPEDSKSEKDRKKRHEDYKSLIKNDAYNGGGDFSPDEMKMLRDMNPASAAAFMDERLQKKAWSKEQGTAGGPDMSVRGNMLRLAQGATPEKNYSSQEDAPKYKLGIDWGKTWRDAKDQLGNMKADFSVGSDFGSPSNVSPALNEKASAVGDAASNVGGKIVDGLNTFGDVIGFPSEKHPSLSPAQMTADTIGALYNGAPIVDTLLNGPPAPGTPPAATQGVPAQGAAPQGAPPQGEVPPPAQGVPGANGTGMGAGTSGAVSAGGSVRVKGKTPGNAQAPEVPVDPRIAAMQENEKALTGLINSQAERDQQKIKNEADIIQYRNAEQARLAANNAAEQKAYDDTMKQHMDGLTNLRAQVAALSKQSVDPNRFWNNKDAGQKFAALIAGACFGFTGQGLQYSQQLDHLVQQDVQNQANELQRQRALLGDQVELENNLIQMAEKQGLKGMQRYNAAVMALRAQAADQIELNTLNFQQQDVKDRAQKEVIELRKKNMDDAAKYAKDAQTDAMDKKYKLAQINHLNAQTFETYAQARQREAAALGGGRGGSGQEMKPSQQERISDLLSVGDNIAEMATQYRKQGGGMGSGVTSLVPGGYTDASKWQGASRHLHAQTIGKPLEGGKLTEGDYPKYLDRFIPSATDSAEGAQNKIDNLVTYATSKYQDELRSLDAAGVRYSNLPTPEQYAKAIRAKIADKLSTERPAQ